MTLKRAGELLAKMVGMSIVFFFCLVIVRWMSGEHPYFQGSKAVAALIFGIISVGLGEVFGWSPRKPLQ